MAGLLLPRQAKPKVARRITVSPDSRQPRRGRRRAATSFGREGGVGWRARRHQALKGEAGGSESGRGVFGEKGRDGCARRGAVLQGAVRDPGGRELSVQQSSPAASQYCEDTETGL